MSLKLNPISGLGILIVSLLTLGQSTRANDIEGSDPQVVLAYESPLQSAVKIEFFAQESVMLDPSEGSCTATLVAKNTLLTAKHCTDDLVMTLPMKVNGVLYRVIAVESPSEMENEETRTLTDVSLVLLSPFNSIIDPLASVPALKIGNLIENNTHQYSREFVMAGFGLDAFPKMIYGGTTPTQINAGISMFLQADYTDVRPHVLPQGFFREVAKSILPKVGLAKDSLASFAQHEDVVMLEAKGNSSLSLMAVMQSAKQSIESNKLPTVLPGDSGGPAIAQFTKNTDGLNARDQFVVVGVASTMMAIPAPVTNVSIKVVKENRTIAVGTVKDVYNSDKTKIDAQATLLAIQTALGNALKDQNLLSPEGLILNDIQIVLKAPRLMISQYASVHTAKNALFIQNALIKLKSMQNHIEIPVEMPALSANFKGI